MFNIEGNFITYNGRRFAVFLPVIDHTQHDKIIYELLGIERLEDEIDRLRNRIDELENRDYDPSGVGNFPLET